MLKPLLFLLLILMPLSVVFAASTSNPIPTGPEYKITLPVGTYANYTISHYPPYSSAGFVILNVTGDYGNVSWYVEGQSPSNGTLMYSIGSDVAYYDVNGTAHYFVASVPVLDKPFIATNLHVQDQIVFYDFVDRITRIGVAEFLGAVRKVAVEESITGGYSFGWDWQTGLLLYAHTNYISIDITNTNAFESYIGMVNWSPYSWVYLAYFMVLSLLDYYLYVLAIIAFFLLYRYLPNVVRDIRHKHKRDPEAERVLRIIEGQEEEVTVG